MACVRPRRGQWVVDWRDATGRRRWKTFPRKADADLFLADALKEHYGPRRAPRLHSACSVADYGQEWLETVRLRLRHATWLSYEQTLRVHVVPAIGHLKLRDVGRIELKEWLRDLLVSGRRRSTVTRVQLVMSSMMSSAVEDELIARNPTKGIGRSLGLRLYEHDEEQDRVRAMTEEQLAVFLDTAASVAPELFLAYMVLSYTGVREGECLGMKLDDYDERAGTIRIARQFTEQDIEAPLKTKAGRRLVHVAAPLARAIRQDRARRRERCFAEGRDLSPYLAVEDPRRHTRYRLRKRMRRTLKEAGLEGTWTPHSLRHTWASILLSRGHSIVYVSRQLGHAKLATTLELYGHWLPMRDIGAVSDLAAAIEEQRAGRQGDLDFGVDSQTTK